MGRYLTSEEFIAQFGETEVRQIAGNGDFNSLEGSMIDPDMIEREISYVDELIAGYVLSRHPWVGEQVVADIPNLLKGLGGDIVRYRLRDKKDGKGQVSDTVGDRFKDALKRLEAIQMGKLDLPRDTKDGAGLGVVELPNQDIDVARISGPVPQSAKVLEGY
jgi:phage gp36-like protein